MNTIKIGKFLVILEKLKIVDDLTGHLLFAELYRFYSPKWVKDHSSNTYNEVCDVLAKTARQNKGI